MPFDTLTGIVQSVDRSTNTCLVQLGLDTVGEFLIQRPTIPATYRGLPPPPLSYVDIRQKETGVWRVEGDVSFRRPVVHDDFLITPGDTPWTGIGTAGTTAQNTSGVGTLAVNSSATAGTAFGMRKDAYSCACNIPQGGAYWFACRMAINYVTANSVWGAAGMGTDNWMLGNAAIVGDRVAAVSWDTGVSTTNLLLATVNGTSSTNTQLPFTPTVGVFFDVDLVVICGEFAAIWIDGGGPYISTSNVPAATSGFTPTVTSWTYTALIRETDYDWFHVEVINPVAHPLRDLILPESAIVG